MIFALSLTILAASFLIPPSPTLPPPQNKTETGYAIKAKAKGLPWNRTEGTEPMELSVSSQAVRAVSEDSGDGVIIHFDRKVVQTIDSKAKAYDEDPLSILSDLGKDRKKARDKLRKQILLKSDTDEDADRYLEKYGLRRDGTTLINMKKVGEPETIGGETCDQYRILENGVPVLSIWSAPDLPRPEALIRLFSGTGIFPRLIAERFETIPGFPMRIEIDMDFGLAEARIFFEIESMEKKAASALVLAPPADFVKRVQPLATIHYCPICKVEVKATSKHQLFVPNLGRCYYDTAEHRKDHIKQL